MLCDICKQKKARIFYTEVINGEKHEQHLCEDCASVYQGFASKDAKAQGISFGNILSGILANYAQGLEEIKHSQKTCRRCGMTEQEFLAKGRFGCVECYDTFADVLENNLKVIQGADTHIGKSPVDSAPSGKRKEADTDGAAKEKAASPAAKKGKAAAGAAEKKAPAKKDKKAAAETGTEEKTGTTRRRKVSAQEAREIKKDELKERLNRAIEAEDYESAAKLRDEIRSLDKVPASKN